MWFNLIWSSSFPFLVSLEPQVPETWASVAGEDLNLSDFDQAALHIVDVSLLVADILLFVDVWQMSNKFTFMHACDSCGLSNYHVLKTQSKKFSLFFSSTAVLKFICFFTFSDAQSPLPQVFCREKPSRLNVTVYRYKSDGISLLTENTHCTRESQSSTPMWEMWLWSKIEAWRYT